MELTTKSIVNGLFEAKIVYEKLEVTAIGQTRDEATKNALGWLRRELEMLAKSPENIEDFELQANALNEKQSLLILKGEEWKQREREIQLMAQEVGKIALKTAVKYAVKQSVVGAVGLELLEHFL